MQLVEDLQIDKKWLRKEIIRSPVVQFDPMTAYGIRGTNWGAVVKADNASNEAYGVAVFEGEVLLLSGLRSGPYPHIPPIVIRIEEILALIYGDTLMAYLASVGMSPKCIVVEIPKERIKRRDAREWLVQIGYASDAMLTSLV